MRIYASVILFFVGAVMVSGAQEPAEVFSKSHHRYLEQLAKLDGPQATRRIMLNNAYLHALRELQVSLKKKGKSGPADAARRESSRFMKTRTWESAETARLPPEVAGVHKKYAAESRRIEEAYSSRKKIFQNNYGGFLEKLKKHLTVKGEIETALLVDKTLKQLPGLKPPEDPRPFLAEGKQPRDIPDANALLAYLPQTRWKLYWTGGPFATGPDEEVLEFRHGGILRMVNGDGTEERVRMTATKDLSVITGGRTAKTIFFDPSFTTFNMTEAATNRRRRGVLTGRLDASGSKPASLATGLLLYYPLDEVTQVIRDASGNKRDGRSEMTATVYFGKRRNACQFDGRRSRIEAMGKLDPDAFQALTISLWFKVDQDRKPMPILGWAADDRDSGTYIRVNRGMVEYRLGSGDRKTSPRGQYKYVPGEWNHVVLTHDQSAGNLFYLNGELKESLAALPLKGNADVLRLGAGKPSDKNPPDPQFSGWLDEVLIYSRALTPDEVKALYKLQPIPGSSAP